MQKAIIDVSECRDLRTDGTCKDFSHLWNGEYHSCDGDCKYVLELKLQQAKEEIKRLKRKKEIVSEVAKDYAVFEDRYWQLKEENERLKLDLETITQCNLKNLEDFFRLTKALEEIREYLDLPDFYYHGTDTIHNEILDKINEVLKEGE